MIEVKSLGDLSIVVDDVEVATQFYRDLFDVEELISFKELTSPGFSKNMGLEEGAIALKILKFKHCNLSLELLKLPSMEESPTSDFSTNRKGLQAVTLQVSDSAHAFNMLKGKEGVEVLGKEDFQPEAWGEIDPNSFTIGPHEEWVDQKERIAKNLAGKHFFLIKDKYGVIWKIEERVFDTHF